ncbi:hypothetical protein RRG08_006606 [Elysia crispata]|uniref:Uncharacterized protein n=1 Tax=Elysia crispata TaxID=231223 RepID=A0AAE1D5Y2_9GAST|nr:hypothetical protein RRG08_006606 [Elysia crispata]
MRHLPQICSMFKNVPHEIILPSDQPSKITNQILASLTVRSTISPRLSLHEIPAQLHLASGLTIGVSRLSSVCRHNSYRDSFVSRRWTSLRCASVTVFTIDWDITRVFLTDGVNSSYYNSDDQTVTYGASN